MAIDTAILIIDTWDDYHVQHDFMKDLMQKYICKIASLLDHTLGPPNLPVVLACYAPPAPAKGGHHMIAHRCSENDRRDNSDRITSINTQEILDFLRKRKITTIAYAGFSLPGCIETRAVGLEKMRNEFKCKIIADCTLDMYNSHYDQYDRLNELYRYMKLRGYEYTFSQDVIGDFNG